MRKKFYTILFLFILCGLFVSGQSAKAGVVWFSGKDISVDFDGLPFNLGNWAPGMDDSKNIVIKNNESFDIDVYFKAGKISGDDFLPDALTVAIGGQSEHLSYLFDNYFFLGSVNSKSSRDYDVSVSFDSDAGNEYQNKTINFDFIVAVEEVGSSSSSGQIVIPGGGGFFPLSLDIYGELEGTVSTTSATIIWRTNYNSTSQVIYSLEGEEHDLILDNPPEGTYFGYAYAEPLPENSEKVRVHIVTITGLKPGATYYYRCVSRASPPTIGKEHSFVTLSATPGPTSPIAPTPPYVGPTPAPPGATPGASSETGATSEPGPGPGPIPGPPGTGSPSIIDAGTAGGGFGANMLAAIGSIMDSKFLSGLSIFLLVLLAVLLLKEIRYRYLKRKRKKQVG